MPIPELEVARVTRLLDKFCDRVPVAVRPELAYVYRFEGMGGERSGRHDEIPPIG